MAIVIGQLLYRVPYLYFARLEEKPCEKKNSLNLHPFLGAEKVFVHFNQLHTHKRCATQLGEIVHAEDDDT